MLFNKRLVDLSFLIFSGSNIIKIFTYKKQIVTILDLFFIFDIDVFHMECNIDLEQILTNWTKFDNRLIYKKVLFT